MSLAKSKPNVARMLSFLARTLGASAVDVDSDWSDSSWGAPDGHVLGYALVILGLFLLGNAIILRSPRGLLEERLGSRRMKLRSIRELVFHRVQMTLGFAFLIGGYFAMLYAEINPRPIDAPKPSASLWIGLVVALGIASEFGAWWFSLQTFRRQLRRWFLENPPEFETDMALAREVGELFGVESNGDDTVQSFCQRLRKAIDLPAATRSSGPRAAGEMSPGELSMERDADEAEERAR